MSISIAEFRALQKAAKKARPKYRNTPMRAGSEQYRSKKEYEFHVMCKVQGSARDPRQRIVKVEREVYYQLVPTQRDAKGKLLERAMGYFLDFRLTYGDGRVEHVDVKSPATRKLPAWVAKRKLMLERHDIHILEV